MEREPLDERVNYSSRFGGIRIKPYPPGKLVVYCGDPACLTLAAGIFAVA